MAKLLYDRRILRAIGLKDVFHLSGKPVFVGGFAVQKKGEPASGFEKVTRFILNMVPTNAYMKLLYHDTDTLSPSTA